MNIAPATTEVLQKTAQKTMPVSSQKITTAKERFQKKHGLYEDKNHFMLLVATPLFEENNANVWAELLGGISDLGFQIVIRANASAKYKEIVESFLEEHSGLSTIIAENEYQEAYDVADVLLTFSEDSTTQKEVFYALEKGVIPVVAHNFPLSYLENYNPNLENGNCFMYYKHSAWSIFATLVRAYENYRFPYDWKNICKAAVQSVKSVDV